MIEQLLSDKQLLTYYTRVSDIGLLYSETERDPLIEAKCDAPGLAVDKEGNPLPYEIIAIPRPINKVEVQILVFRDKEAHEVYLKKHEISGHKQE